MSAHLAHAARHPFSLGAKKRGKETFSGGFSTAPCVPERKAKANRPLCSGLARRYALRSAQGQQVQTYYSVRRHATPPTRGHPLTPCSYAPQYYLPFVGAASGRPPEQRVWASTENPTKAPTPERAIKDRPYNEKLNCRFYIAVPATPAHAAGHPFSLRAKKRGKETLQGGFSTAPLCAGKEVPAIRPLCSGLARRNALRSAHGAAGTNCS